jgi:hypothetical protein
MTQYNFGTIDPDTKTGTALATDLNSWRDALHSTHKGSVAPTYAIAGMQWIDDASTPWLAKRYDGADWITEGSINASTNQFIPYRAGVALGTVVTLNVGSGLVSDGSNNLKSAHVLNSRSSTYTAVESDRAKTIDCTATMTLNLTAAATLGDGWFAYVRATTGTVTIDPNGSELIDGLSTVPLVAGESCIVVCTGAAFKTVGRSSAKTKTVQAKTAAYTVVAGDLGTVIHATAGTPWTLSLTAAATLGSGFWFELRNNHTGVVTVDPNGAETIDGASTASFAANDAAIVWTNGTAWYTIGKKAVFSFPVSAKSVDYTLVAGDNGTVINYSGLTGGKSLALLPAASAGNGYRVVIVNSDPTYQLTITPSAPDNLDGQPNLKTLSPNDRVELVCDGTNWHTLSGMYSVQTQISSPIVFNVSSTSGHSLRRKPNYIRPFIRCITAQYGFVAGEEIDVDAANATATANNYGVTVAADATNYSVCVGVVGVLVTRKDNHALTPITAANWSLHLDMKTIY